MVTKVMWMWSSRDVGLVIQGDARLGVNLWDRVQYLELR